MGLSNKIFLTWLATMWIVFSVWVVAVTTFPLNFGFVGLQALSGIALIWSMVKYNEIDQQFH
ncbi:MAG: hypothetical protein IAX21_11020 [Candidatus Bathyarchaeota archaeon]|nr:hypothetical protein [Candidatus Bathyarchaeum tardum]WGM88600.1 MAG: hypothetical protein NUK63_06665 [Candidatus Bathyarchaeum tardum]WNZ29144.1 MAG: hypothetical protein IAX21_11020 [Candidatus Bathyarchaeota archaeon]